MGSTTTNRHGDAAFDFVTVSGCDQLFVAQPTEVSDLLSVAVVAPIGNSDHSYLSTVISMAQAVLNMCVSIKVSLKHHVIWNIVCGAIRDLPW